MPFSSILSKISLWAVCIGGFIQAGFMVNIILSGNFSFLNHLTIIPALACLDDACWPKFVHKFAYGSTGRRESWNWRNKFLLDILLLGLVGSLSWPVIAILLQLGGKHQLMNASFDRFKLVNTYGAFVDVGKAHYEPIVSISYNIGQDKNWSSLVSRDP